MGPLGTQRRDTVSIKFKNKHLDQQVKSVHSLHVMGAGPGEVSVSSVLGVLRFVIRSFRCACSWTGTGSSHSTARTQSEIATSPVADVMDRETSVLSEFSAALCASAFANALSTSGHPSGESGLVCEESNAAKGPVSTFGPNEKGDQRARRARSRTREAFSTHLEPCPS